MPTPDPLSAIEAFDRLTADIRDRLAARLQTRRIARGDILIQKGESAETLYLVASGLFDVSFDSDAPMGIEIGRGQPIGEIGFFSGTPRSAQVTAKRDSVVLALTRDDFEQVAHDVPDIKDAIIRFLSERLVKTSDRLGQEASFAPSHTLAIVQAGSGPIPDTFKNRLVKALRRHGTLRDIDINTPDREFSRGLSPDSLDAALWLEALGRDTDHLVFWTDPNSPAWTQKYIRQADELLLVARVGSQIVLTELEQMALALHGRERTRLVLVHDQAAPLYPGTSDWLKQRAVVMHHHVGLDATDDYTRLARFLTGRAAGFVAGGGGAFCAAHIGVYKAFYDRDIRFDFYGGTSGGGAMAAAFAAQMTPQEIDARTHDIFITRGALQHVTIPRYSLLDHTYFDRALNAHYGNTCIEDLAIPFFALSTDLATGQERCHRHGLVWQAVRATGSIPALLPPFLTDEGDVLVDGSLADNVPLATMHRLKTGPNIVVDLPIPKLNRPQVTYDSLPGRWHIARAMCSPFAALPRAPNLANVIVRSMMMSRQAGARPGPHDRVISPPLPTDMNILDWRRHTALMHAAAAHTDAEIEQRINGQDSIYRFIVEEL